MLEDWCWFSSSGSPEKRSWVGNWFSDGTGALSAIQEVSDAASIRRNLPVVAVAQQR